MQNINESLLAAAKAGHTERVAHLLECGADIDARGQYNSTPLILAAQGGHAQTVALLCERGANINARDNNDTTPLSAASWRGDIGLVRLLLDLSPQFACCRDALMGAAVRGQLTSIMKISLGKLNILMSKLILSIDCKQ